MKIKASEFRHPTRPLGELVDVLDYKRRPVNSSERAARTGSFPYYGANGQVGTIDDYLFDEPLVLVAEDGGFFDDPVRPIAYSVAGKCWVNNHAHVLRPRAELVNQSWLTFAVGYQDVQDRVNGATRPKLTQKELVTIPVPVPPLPEQRRVVARIQDLMSRVDEISLLRSEISAEVQNVLPSTVTERMAEFRSRYEEGALGSLVGDSPGAMASGPFGSQLKHEEFVQDGHLVIGIANVQRDRFDPVRRWMVNDDTLARLGRYRVAPNDLLITIMGTVGRTCIVPSDIGVAVTSKHVYRVRLPAGLMDPRFVSIAINFDRETMRRLLGEAVGGVMPGLNSSKLRALKLPVPPMEVQRQFIEHVDRLKAIETVRSHNEDAPEQHLRGAILRKAFSGEL